MKSCFCTLLFICSVFFASAQVFDVETIKGDINDNTKLNLVILSEGYQTSEFAQFKIDAESLVNALFTQSPFLEYTNYFNVHIIKVPSNESGADHPVTATDIYEPGGTPEFVDTYFNATFDAFSIHRFLYYGIDYADAASAELKIISVLSDNFPTYDQALILVNSPEYGGTGGEFPISSTNASEIAIHELGHSLFDLKDEYYPGDALAAEAINMTQETSTTDVRWKNWIGTNNIGIYAYATTGTAATWNRPHQTCKMRYLGYPFCSVCKEGIVEKIHSLISPISNYTPNNNTITNPTFPLDFELDLIKPIPNTLESKWTLNNVTLASNVDNVTILETDLTNGVNTLTTVIHDNSTFLKVDNHENFHINTINWTINYTTLGIETIKSEINNYNITLYPNPTQSILNLGFESQSIANIKVEIISIDGKKVKSINISSHQAKQIDISALSQGVYIANFYVRNSLITSKRLVKK